MEVGTLQYLNKYIFRERKYKNIIKKCSENIYIVENEDCEPLFLGSHGVFIAHDSCLFVEKKDWRVTSSS
jgi:hypothetical protein